tara:strand:+ start:1853 stop:2230 length:378 start_codon:yes stop_codon:yes gene_type:complete
MSLVKLFNNHWLDFLGDLLKVYPNDYDIKTGLTWSKNIITLTPLIVIKTWNYYVVSKYKKQIENGDITFFEHNNYNDDINDINNQTIQLIEKFRKVLTDATNDTKLKSMKYVQNLTKIANLYYKK